MTNKFLARVLLLKPLTDDEEIDAMMMIMFYCVFLHSCPFNIRFSRNINLHYNHLILLSF